MMAVGIRSAEAVTREVPARYPTIQAAIDAAVDGDTVRVAPGVYTQGLKLASKTIVLASHFVDTGKPELIDETIIDGGRGDYAIRIEATAGEATTIVGFTIRHGSDGVSPFAHFRFLNNHVTHNGDGIDYEKGSGGLVRDCLFEDNSDDGIDLDDDVGVVIEQNTIRNNHDDGIEIRLQKFSGSPLDITIRHNVIEGNGEDGIQLIGYDVPTARTFRIERNLILDNAMAGIGMMCCHDTKEDYQAASLPEPVQLFNNTFIGNDYGVTGGDNVVALNNIFSHTTHVALKGVDGKSTVRNSLFFGNGTDHAGSNVDRATTRSGDPLLDADYTPLPGSPAIDAGAASFVWNSKRVLHVAAGDYVGAAPDIGVFEAEGEAPGARPARVESKR